MNSRDKERDKLKQQMLTLTKDDLHEMELVLTEELPKETFKFIDKLIKIDESSDKTSIIHISNSEFLTFIVAIMNNHEYYYSEIKKDCDAVAHIVNNWDYVEVHKLLLNLTPTEIYSTDKNSRYYRLGLTEELKKYNIDNIFSILDLFISLKARINQILEKKDMSLVAKKEYIQYIYNSISFSDFISNIKKYKEEIKSEHDRRHKIARQKIKILNDLIPQIENDAIFNITTVQEEWHNYLQPELLQILYEITFKNLNHTKNTLDMREFLITKYLKRGSNELLYSLNINPQDVPKEIKENLDSQIKGENFQAKINFLLKLGIHPYNIIFKYYQILPNITDEMINFFTFLLDNKIISKETTTKILPTIETSYKTIKNNYEIIKNHLDFNNPFYNDSILLLGLDELHNRLSVLKEYSNLPSNTLFLLVHMEYLYILDLLIEKEINPLYLISICQTEKPLDTLKRILIYREIGEEYTNPNGTLKKEITEGTKSFISSKNIDSYFENVVPEVLNYQTNAYNQSTNPSEVIASLQKYEYNTNIYMIGDVLISKPKFIRHFTSSENKDIISCLITDSILSPSEYVSLRKELSSSLTY